jgi:hypothetical protein
MLAVEAPTECEFPYRFVPDADPRAVAMVMALWQESEDALALGAAYELDKDFAARIPHNYFLYATQLLVVEDKMTQELVPLRFKQVQREIAMVILHDWIVGLPIRLIVLKARREGVSTLTQSFMLWVTANRRNRKAFTMADSDDTASYLHGMGETFYENLPDAFAPMRGVSRAGKVLEFSNPTKNRADKKKRPGLMSWLRTVTHASAGAGKGSTILHLSELALWPPEKAAKSLGTVLQVVPRAPRTMVLMESTARGIGNLFHQLYQRARMGVSELPRRSSSAGRRSRRTRAQVPAGFHAHRRRGRAGARSTSLDGRAAPVAPPDDRERVLRRHGHLSPGVPDRRGRGLPGVRPALLRRSPSCSDYVRRWQMHPGAGAGRPPGRGRLRSPASRTAASGWVFFTREPRRFTLRIWDAPHELDDYLVFGDAAGGKPDQDILVAGETRPMKARGDWHAAYVFSRSELRIVAAWHGRTDRDEYGDHLYRLGKLYSGVTHTMGDLKGALIAVEISGGWGQVPLSRLKWRGYQRLYHRPIAEDVTSRDRSLFLGWDTTPKDTAADARRAQAGDPPRRAGMPRPVPLPGDGNVRLQRRRQAAGDGGHVRRPRDGSRRWRVSLDSRTPPPRR